MTDRMGVLPFQVESATIFIAMNKTFALLLITSLFSPVAHASDLFGGWQTAKGTMTLYREDRTVDYIDCKVRLKLAADSAESPSEIRIEDLDLDCKHPTYWDIHTFLSPVAFSVSPAGEVRLPDGKVGQYSSDLLDLKFEADGEANFIRAKRKGDALSFEWSTRSFDRMMFDLVAESMSPAP